MNKEEIKQEEAEDIVEKAIRSSMQDITDELVKLHSNFDELGSNLVELANELKKATELCHKTLSTTQKGFEKMMDKKAKRLAELQKLWEGAKK